MKMNEVRMKRMMWGVMKMMMRMKTMMRMTMISMEVH
jgi:hypothetical protein